MDKGVRFKQMIAIKNAVDDFLKDPIKNNIGHLCSKYKISKETLKDELSKQYPDFYKEWHGPKFDFNVFDIIDTEEKAYWLGFLYADGYVSNIYTSKGVLTHYNVELSLSGKDVFHLLKFSKFLKNKRDNVKLSNIMFKGKVYDRCRLLLSNKYFRNRLIELGCTPQKSLILKFPDIEIFKDQSLIRHFIRGYWDGDGSLSHSNKEHTIPFVNVLGTEDFLTVLKSFLPITSNAKMRDANKGQHITKQLGFCNKNAFKIMYYLYHNATIYLDRKYEIYKYYCRLYEKLYRELSGKIGESCNANTEVNSEITKGSESL